MSEQTKIVFAKTDLTGGVVYYERCVIVDVFYDSTRIKEKPNSEKIVELMKAAVDAWVRDTEEGKATMRNHSGAFLINDLLYMKKTPAFLQALHDVGLDYFKISHDAGEDNQIIEFYRVLHTPQC